MDPKKQVLINSVISFLQDELNSSTLSEERKESIEVAIQCLETAFEVENQTNQDKVDLLSFITIKQKVEVSEERKAEAEEYKTSGNNFMKTAEYDKAVIEYSKAIDLNPYNSVYYCNRAAAYTRLQKDNDAINDCNEAIKLDPTYGKAYGRLGIAYSNLNQYDLAYKAYQSALKYDPNNAMYETNLKVAAERLRADMDSGASSVQLPDPLREFINNPNIINMASQILSDPSFCNMMSGIMTNAGPTGDNMPSAVQAMLQAGQNLAQRVASEDPEFYSRLSSNLRSGQDGSNPDGSNSNEQPPENKDQGPA